MADYNFYGNEKVKTVYRGVVVDSLKTLPPRWTKNYDTYKEAHDAAEKLCKRTYGDRGFIEVQESETGSFKNKSLMCDN